MWKAFLPLALLLATGDANDCAPYKFDNVIVACVCNATYCDSPPDYNGQLLEKGISYWYVTNKQGLRMSMSQKKFGIDQSSTSDVILNVDATKRYQTIFGFGGAFTDAVGINLKNLSLGTRDHLIRTYFDRKTGSRYNLGRIPIGGSDFSTRPYTYDEVENDTKLEHFALTREDYDYKIPFAKRALELNPETKFFSAAWSPPKWMKTNNKLNGFGFLKDDCRQIYANYLVKFLDEYEKNGLKMWAISTGNEPTNALRPNFPLTSMGWTPQGVADWVADYLGPTLESSKHNDTLILTLDDNRIVLPWFVKPMFTNEKSSKYCAGTAVHWYYDADQPSVVLDLTHDAYPDKIILMTEASVGPRIWGTPSVVKESWIRGENYILSIIEYMNHWGVAWVDWNLAINDEGGPNWIFQEDDGTIIVNSSRDEFYKLPMFYAIQHFSRFVERGSTRISITDSDAIKSAAFLTPSNEIVAVLYNRDNSTKRVTLKDSKKEGLSLDLSPKSMNTIIYKH